MQIITTFENKERIEKKHGYNKYPISSLNNLDICNYTDLFFKEL